MCESGLNDGKITYEKHVEGTGFTLGDKPLNVERDTVLAVVRGIVYRTWDKPYSRITSAVTMRRPRRLLSGRLPTYHEFDNEKFIQTTQAAS